MELYRIVVRQMKQAIRSRIQAHAAAIQRKGTAVTAHSPVVSCLRPDYRLDPWVQESPRHRQGAKAPVAPRVDYRHPSRKTHLSRFVEQAASGQTIIIAKAGKPLATLAPVQPPERPRSPGFLKGRMKIARDFDAPLPD